MKLKAFCSVTFFYFLIFAFLFIGKCLHAQITSDTSQQTKEYYKRGKINLGEKKVYVIKKIIIEKDSVLFTDVVTSMDHIAAISDIKELQIKTGTKAIGSAALGLALVFILTLETMVDNEPNPDDIALRYSASLIMGALIGAGIGLAIPVRQTYDFNTRSLQSK